MPYSRLFYHFVWATRERLPLITPINREHIYRAIHAKAHEFRAIVYGLNGMPDHIHLVVTVPPSVALSAFIGQIKGGASHLASRLPNAEPFAWQAEYGVLTISERYLPIVVGYVAAQQMHHANNTLNPQLEMWD